MQKTKKRDERYIICLNHWVVKGLKERMSAWVSDWMNKWWVRERERERERE